MAKYAVIDAGVVTNMVRCDDASFAAAQGWEAAPPYVTRGWTWDGSTFTAPVASLAEAQTKKWKELVEASEANKYGTLTIGPYTISLSEEARGLINQASASALAAYVDGEAGTWSGKVEMEDGSLQTVSAAQMRTIVKAVHAHSDDWLANKVALRDAIQSAATTTEVDAIDVTAGWPT